MTHNYGSAVGHSDDPFLGPRDGSNGAAQPDSRSSTSSSSTPLDPKHPRCHRITDNYHYEDFYDDYGFQHTTEREQIDPDISTIGAVRKKGRRSRSAAGTPSERMSIHRRPASALASRRNGGAYASLDEDDASVTNTPTPKGRTWGGSLINGAVSAAVFGAAVGLTAYRFWRGWGAEMDEDDFADEDGGSYLRKGPGSSQPGSTVRSCRTPVRYATPRRPASTSSSQRSPGSHRARRKRTQRPSIADLMAANERAHPPSPSSGSGTTVLVSETSKSPMMETVPLAEVVPVHGEERGDGREVNDHEDHAEVNDRKDHAERNEKMENEHEEPQSGQDEGDSDDETNARLDEMARRLQGLIAEAERALASKASSESVAEAEAAREAETPLRKGRRIISSPAPASIPSTPVGSLLRRHSTRTSSTRQGFTELSKRPTIAIPGSQNISLTSKPFPAATMSPTVATTPLTPGGSSVSRERRTSSGTASRGLPPYPWRRDPSGSPRWVQRPLSPSPERRSITPVPPVPPIPPELAHAVAPPSRPSSLIRTGSMKRYSSPSLKLAARKLRSVSVAASPSPTLSPALEIQLIDGLQPSPPSPPPDTQSPASPSHVSPTPTSPISPVSPTSPTSPTSPHRAASRIPRHVRSQSFASPPASPTPTRPLTAASTGGSPSCSSMNGTSTPTTPRRDSLHWRKSRWPSGIVAARAAALGVNQKPYNGYAIGATTPPNPVTPGTPGTPSTPPSIGSGRSRIPVRRSIDPDAFAAFGRLD